MADPIIILHATDASENAKQLQTMLFEEGVFSLTIQEILLQGPLNIADLVASSPGVIVVLSPRLFEDTICTVTAQHALDVYKGTCVQVKAIIDAPEWADKPINLESGEMFDVNWSFLMIKLRSFLDFSELRDDRLWQE